MGKQHRRSKGARVVARLERSLRGTDAHLIEQLEGVIFEQERRRFWLGMGCPVAPLSS